MTINIKIILTLLAFCSMLFSCDKPAQKDPNLILWYDKPAERWGEAFPIGNGRLAAMNFGGLETERFQINEESLWAGSQINPYAENFSENLKKIQKMVFEGEYSKAHDFGVKNLTARPTSFRSYEPFADLLIKFEGQDDVSDYKRELNMSTGISRITYKSGETEYIRESFISAPDDVLCIRLFSAGEGKINCRIGMERFEGARVTALSEGKLNLDGQVIDIEAPEGYDDNPGESGPGGKHMRFAGRLSGKVSGGSLQAESNNLVVENADEAVLIFTAATDYNLSLLNFDRSIDPGKKADEILEKAEGKSWEQLRDAHISEHSEMFSRVSLELGESPNDTLPIDKRIEAYKDGSGDQGLIVQMFQFGRYLLMGSSRGPAILPANLQGKWNEREWAPWEADYHLNVNLQMNYWPSDVINLPETNEPLIDWFEQITEIGEPYADTMYNAKGWFCSITSNPFGRVTPSASTPESQFINGVLDPLAGAWMVMNLWDHYEYTQDLAFLKERLFPMLRGASQYILDVLIPDSEGILHFVPSTSPENSYIDPDTGRRLRITATSTYHLSVIKAVFEATLEAAKILNYDDPVTGRIGEAETLLPSFPVDENGKLMEWRENFEEAEPGHRHLSHLLCVHPFSLITPDDPKLFEAAEKSLDWRKENGQGSGGGWSGAHASIMYAWFQDNGKALHSLESILNSLDGTLLNAQRIFQIDANFGATSAVAEMLIQSHMKDKNGNFIIHLLPAIPSEWPSGSVKGLCARGGYTVDMEWEEGNITSASVTAKNSATCKIQYHDKIFDLALEAGESRELAYLMK